MIKKINKKNSLVGLISCVVVLLISIVLLWPATSHAIEKKPFNQKDKVTNLESSDSEQNTTVKLSLGTSTGSIDDYYYYINGDSWASANTPIFYADKDISAMYAGVEYVEYYPPEGPVYSLYIICEFPDGSYKYEGMMGLSELEILYYGINSKYVCGFTLNGQTLPVDGEYHQIDLSYNMDFRCVMQENPPVLPYQCTFNANGGQWTDGSTSKVIEENKGYAYTFPEENPEYENMHFNGWYYGDAKIDESSIYSTYGDQTLDAHWNNEITYNSNYLDGPEPLKEYKEINEPIYIAGDDTFTREGYVLAGWNTSPDGTGQSYDCGAEYSDAKDLTLYAQWSYEDTHIEFTSGYNKFQKNSYEGDSLVKSEYSDDFSTIISWNDSFTYEYIPKKGNVSAKLSLMWDNFYKYEFFGIGEDITVIDNITCNGKPLTEGTGNVETINNAVTFNFDITWKQDTTIIEGSVRDEDTDDHVPHTDIYISDDQANIVAYTQADNFGAYYTYEDGDTYKWGCAFLKDYIPLFDDLRRDENEQSFVGNEFYIIKGSNINIRSNDGLKGYTFDGFAQKNVKAISLPIADFDFASDKNSTISVDGKQLNIDEHFEYYDDYDGNYKITANALDGFEFASWAINGEEVEDGYTGVVGEDGLTIQANMVPIEEPEPIDPVVDPEFINGNGPSQTGDNTAVAVFVLMMLATLSSVAILKNTQKLNWCRR